MALNALKSSFPELAKFQVQKDLDLRLAFIKASKGVDKFYHILGLSDDSGESFCFCYWGDTGSRDTQSELHGPFTEKAMREHVAKIFKEYTGRDLASQGARTRSLPGKYWLQKNVEEKCGKCEKCVWEYYVDDEVDGKTKGWHPYEEDASNEVESLHQQFVADGHGGRYMMRIISSGHFSYKVNLKAMTQRNTSTGKSRQIRRASGEVKKLAKVSALKMSCKRSKPMKSKESVKAPRTKVMKVMKAMKVTKVVKAKKAPKAMKVSDIAVGKRARSKVWKGEKLRTKTGIKKEHLKKNKDGKLVTKKMSEAGRQAFARVACWISACKQARQELGITGFVAVKKGSPLYKKAKELYPTAEPYVI